MILMEFITIIVIAGGGFILIAKKVKILIEHILLGK